MTIADWTGLITSIGTLGAVGVAVWVALWTDQRSGKRLKDERDRSDQAVKDERDYGHAQLEEERRFSREREQLAQAYAVQVVTGEQAVGRGGPVAIGEGVQAEVKRLAVMVVNRGSFTITEVKAQLCLGGKSFQPYHSYQRATGFDEVPPHVRTGFYASPEHIAAGVLTPFDEGIRFETDDIHKDHLVMPYPVVRWKDHWGTHWEHRRGVVRQVSDGDPWEP